MAAFILSIASAVVIGALLWLLAGPRLKLNEEPVQNEVLNVLVYIGDCLFDHVPSRYLVSL